MFYYEVLVSSPSYHGKEALTYHYGEQLLAGQVVRVSLRNRDLLGLIIRNTSKPQYATKPISLVLTSVALPGQLLALATWLYDYYPAPLGVIAQQFLPQGLLLAKPPLPPQINHDAREHTPLPPLSPQQKSAVTAISQSHERSFLLHGDTGTGKTRVYMELAQEMLAKDLSVLILTPEIGLTPQLVAEFERHFSQEVIVLHSHQTIAERRTQWLRVLYSNSPQIVIGPRSALFAPIQRLGLIVVDEAHDSAYKQEQLPRYNALRVAAKLAQLHNALFITGSATPPVGEYWLAERRNTPILRLDELPNERQIEREVTVVNLKEKDHFTKSSHLSNELISAITKALANKQQALVFLNRRGTARLVLCQVCGWTALCPRCDLPLTYHDDTHHMRCHTCGFHTSIPGSCPECSSHDIVFKNIGTKSITAELQKLFPKARVKRYDTDNTITEHMSVQYPELRAGKVDIIVGTQMVAKGIDLPGLSVVGVVLADASLYLPDYSAEERTYQLLTQVIGRVGRGHNKGAVIIQTYQPENPSIKAALTHDWQVFYSEQIREREAFGFPPFFHFLKLTTARASAASAQKSAEALASSLRDNKYSVQIVGPSPAFHEKTGGKYHWQLLIKAKQRQELLNIIAALPSGWTHDIDPLTLL